MKSHTVKQILVIYKNLNGISYYTIRLWLSFTIRVLLVSTFQNDLNGKKFVSLDQPSKTIFFPSSTQNRDHFINQCYQSIGERLQIMSAVTSLIDKKILYAKLLLEF